MKAPKRPFRAKRGPPVNDRGRRGASPSRRIDQGRTLPAVEDVDADGIDESAIVRMLEGAVERIRQKRLDLGVLIAILKERRSTRQQRKKATAVSVEETKGSE